MTATPSTLILGWGNPGRADDGLGPALARTMLDCSDPKLTVSFDYQLQIEDAADVANCDRVVFVDADRVGPEPFSCRRLAPAESGLSFTSHSVTPGALLALTKELFRRQPEAWLVGIRGYDFASFEEGLSPGARSNLAATVEFLRGAVRSGRLEELPRPEESESTGSTRKPHAEEV